MASPLDTASVPRNSLGRSGIEVPPLVFGGNVFGWTADEATSFALLDALLAAGYDAIDTADVYSRWAPNHHGGESETVIGKWMRARGNRDRIVVLTKAGMEMPEGQGLSRTWLRRAVDASLHRLQTDYIDVYQAHRDDEATPLEETLAAFGEMIEAGKVRAIGASNYTAPRLRAALDTSAKLGLPRYETLQPHYNLMERAGYEDELEPLCAREGLGVIGYFSLAAGFLTGKYRSEADIAKSPRGGGVKKYLDARGHRVLAALDAAAERYKVTPAQIALAWLVARPSVTAPIASATSVRQLEELLRGVTLALDSATIEELDSASTPG